MGALSTTLSALQLTSWPAVCTLGLPIKRFRCYSQNLHESDFEFMQRPLTNLADTTSWTKNIKNRRKNKIDTYTHCPTEARPLLKLTSHSRSRWQTQDPVQLSFGEERPCFNLSSSRITCLLRCLASRRYFDSNKYLPLHSVHTYFLSVFSIFFSCANYKNNNKRHKARDSFHKAQKKPRKGWTQKVLTSDYM